MHKQPRSKSRLIPVLCGIIAILVVGLVFVLGRQSASQPEQSAAKASSSAEKVAPRSSSQTTKRVATKPQSADQISDLLSNLTQLAGEDSDSQTRSGVTYSRFYRNQGTWYWEMTSNQHTTPREIGQITGATKTDDGIKLQVTSRVYQPGKAYSLRFHWLDKTAGNYNLHTDFENINGDYTLGQFDDVTATTSDTDALLWTVGSGEGVENEATKTDHGATTFSDFIQDEKGDWCWSLYSDKREDVEYGRIESVTTSAGVPTSMTVRSKLAKSRGTVFTVRITYLSGKAQYRLDTDQDNIHGLYDIQTY